MAAVDESADLLQMLGLRRANNLAVAGGLQSPWDPQGTTIGLTREAAARNLAARAAQGQGAPPSRGAHSFGDMYKLARNAGFDEQGALTAAAIGMAESSGNPSAVNKNKNGSTDYGLMQINTVHGEQYAKSALDPQQSFNKAFELSKGGRDFSPWVTFNTGAYRQYLGGNPSAVTPATQTAVPPPPPSPSLTGANNSAGLGGNIFQAFAMQAFGLGG